MSFRAIRAIAVAAATLTSGLPAAGQIGAADDSFPTAIEARIGGDEAQTRFVLDLNRRIDVRAFTLANPYRVVLDIPQVNFKLPAKAGQTGRGLVKAYRFGLVMQGGSRIVIDLAKPARVDKVFVLDPVNGQPARVVVDLTVTDREAFMRAIAQENRAQEKAAPRASYTPQRGSDDPRPLIVLDPGHGGIDTGTKTASIDEKTIVLDFAMLLRDKIEKSGRYRVAMTRADDTFVPLNERVAFARARQASLFISIHADAVNRREGEAQGASIYTLSETASDAEAARLAEAENRADAIAGVDLSTEMGDVADILIDLAQRETKTFSVKFAHTLIAEMKSTARLHKNPLKSAGFIVLRAPDVPSVLVELGYVTNRSDLQALTSDIWRAKTADAIMQAVDQYFGMRVAGSGPSVGRN